MLQDENFLMFWKNHKLRFILECVTPARYFASKTSIVRRNKIQTSQVQHMSSPFVKSQDMELIHD